VCIVMSNESDSSTRRRGIQAAFGPARAVAEIKIHAFSQRWLSAEGHRPVAEQAKAAHLLSWKPGGQLVSQAIRGPGDRRSGFIAGGFCRHGECNGRLFDIAVTLSFR